MGDGGALVTHREKDWDRRQAPPLARHRQGHLGRASDANRKYWWQYAVPEIGYKCHLNDIAAAIGIVQPRSSMR
jgi:dTDP-4-amino-4,6-dideoxygalactose transaminase